MYNVVEMKKNLEDATKIIAQGIRDKFTVAFKEIYRGYEVPSIFYANGIKISKVRVKSLDDLSKITSGAGFYIILSTCPVEKNECLLTHESLRAIYRGECITVKERIKSHLFHKAYKEGFYKKTKKYEENEKNSGRSFYATFWPHCLKLKNEGQSGINVDQYPYFEHEWIVLVHHMKGSSQDVRKIAELAFDDTFGHPAGSRDV